MDHQGRALIRIATPDDPRISDYQRLADPAAIERAGIFVAEGRFVVQRLLTRPRYVTRSVLLTPTAFSALSRSVGSDALARVPVYIAEQDVLDRITGFNIHRGCLALAERPRVASVDPAALTGARRVVVLEGVNNPDNVGGIFRSAAAFDVDVIVLGPACGDPLYRKAIRTSMAATLDVPYLVSTDWPGSLAVIGAAGLRLLALAPRSRGVALDSFSTGGRVALLLGSEGEGLSDQAFHHADEQVHIRMSDRVDSLNVTVAASIAMHHFFR